MGPRLEPIDTRELVPPEFAKEADTAFASFATRLPGPHGMLMHWPPLEEKVIWMGNYFRHGESILAAAERELAIIVVARERDALYVWYAHSNGCRRAGVSEETITNIRDRGDASLLPTEEREIVTYLQQRLRTNRVDQAAFDALKERHGVRWLLELTAVAGYYEMLAAVANAFDVPPPPEGELLPVG